MIKIDDISYKATWIKDSLKMKADILNGPESGRLQGTYKMYIQYGGTFFNYTGILHKDRDCTDTEWHELFLRLSNPINDHKITLPFGVTSKMTQRVYIASIEKGLMQIDKNTNWWTPTYEVQFVGMEPMWKPNQPIKGVK